MVVMVPEGRVIALNKFLKQERANHRATRRALVAALLELMHVLARDERTWSPDRARLYLTALSHTKNIRRAARATGVSAAELRRWQAERRVVNWRGRRALFAIHWRTVSLDSSFRDASHKHVSSPACAARSI